jgi:hypothetical protein
MADDDQLDQLERGLAIGAIGFGVVAAVAPRAFTAAYGLGGDPKLLAITRLWGTRTAVLGGLSLTGGDEARAKMLPWVLGLNVADTVLTARADGIPKRTRALGALTSAAFAGAFGYLALKRR